MHRISCRQNLYTYELADLDDEIINDFFHPEELVRVGDDHVKQNKEFKIKRLKKLLRLKNKE